jgi:hypothetical protein
LVNYGTYLLNILLKAKLQHLIGFIEHHSLQGRKVDVATVDVVQNSSGCADEKVDTSLQIVGLGTNIDTTINCQYLVLILVVLNLA